MSWVRPGVLLAKARRVLRVSTLMVVDLPALERPAKAISGTASGGRPESLAAEMTKRAVSKMLKVTSSVKSLGVPSLYCAGHEKTPESGKNRGPASGGRRGLRRLAEDLVELHGHPDEGRAHGEF